jgi:hypothetical protein
MAIKLAWRGLSVALLAAVVLCAPAYGQVGIAGGVNSNDLSDIEISGGTVDISSTNGWHLGIFLNWNIAVLGFRPGVFFHRVSDFSIEKDDSSARFDLDIVEIPLDVRVRFPSPIVSPYLVAGPVVTFPSSGNESIDASLASTPWRLDVGIGFEINLGLRLWPEARAGFGLSDFFESEIDLGDDVLAPFNQVKARTFLFRLGVSF